MSRTGPLSETWRHALVGGLVALPGTAYLLWQLGSELSLGPVLLGGLVAGYLHAGDTSARRSVGIRVGLIGGLPVLWMLTDVLVAVRGAAGPAWFQAAAVGMGVGAILTVSLLAFGLAAVTGVVGAAIGDWLSRKTGRRQSPATGT
ncbi:DUF5518 domain-containing protein [Haloplanus aerogenes]|uniref:DUF5518 domain-containing protein n=1 Tax=Haloplanus aerogenes TaxID=660522 RepID=A0A3M0D9N0_9EURY|nr:DUF5518 domain-containing protein [Haloplanus aerogenes]AZH26146.1 hypothetical protein DU502_12600 [Haloplanus aerogenes]RMB18401.1 hypothetical protein ATH50_1856 [Haloplanus aerogenes]